MTATVGLGGAIREWFLLDAATARARGIDDAKRERIRALDGASRLRLRVAAGLAKAEAPVATSLRVDALRLAAKAAALATGRTDEEAIEATLAGLDEPTATAVRTALATSLDGFDRQSTRALEELSNALLRARSDLTDEYETRSVAYLRGARAGRRAAVVVALGLIAYHVVTTRLAPPNVARHADVTSSSRGWGTAEPSVLVDGEREATRPFVAADGDPWVELDLHDTVVVKRIVIINRRDGALDAALPITVEVAQTRGIWHPVGEQKLHFRDWSFGVASLRARYVRVHARGYALGLNEIEVYGTVIPEAPGP